MITSNHIYKLLIQALENSEADAYCFPTKD